MGRDPAGGTASPRDTSAPVTQAPAVSTTRVVAAVAWAVVLLGTGAPVVVADEVFAADPGWLLPAQLTLLAIALLLTVVDERIRALQTLVLSLLAVKAMQNVHLADLTRALGVVPPGEAVSSVSNLLLNGVVALALLALLRLRGTTLDALFLTRSDLSARAAPERIPGFRRERPWRRLGAFWGGLTFLLTLAFLLVAGANFAFWEYRTTQLLAGAALITVGAAVNAFQEEFVFRAAPLSELPAVLGKSHATLLLGAAFGLSHYYGTPGGVPGVLMTFFLGWWLGKSVLETRGITLAWTVHFLLDVIILAAWFLT